ncbi:MAG: AbrB/MazE/SpoVT family DNA-binding domain-containing protein [Actinomycetota bacterium]
MRTTIDSAGRIVIPKAIRDELGLRGGEELEVVERDGRIEIEAVPTAMRLVKKGTVLVAETEEPVPALTDRIVRDTLEKTRR